MVCMYCILFSLDGVQVGGVQLPSSSLALVDSGSTYIVGPSDAIGAIAQVNNAICFSMVPNRDPQQIPCDSPFGFDAAAVDCDQPFFDLEFQADGVTYRLNKHDLLLDIETSLGDVCILRLQGSNEIPGWVLGDAFLNKHYAAFDFGNQRVGFARSHPHSADVCHDDLHLNVSPGEQPTSTTPQFGGDASTEENGAALEEAPVVTKKVDTPTTTDAPEWNHSDSQDDNDSDTSMMSGAETFGMAFGVLVIVVALVVVLLRKRRRARMEARFQELAAKHDFTLAEDSPSVIELS
mmetsp:Transcript_1347/g.3398  ORF Transcript_1347/g.3398 Transcript_1347/m.3398 type:complete len:293 (+) Transcript_1347:2-880(+)